MDSSQWPQGGVEGNSPKKTRTEKEKAALNCPRCSSPNTKFCYYNNYSLSQPRYFCKTCRRYWTAGGSLRNVPVGGGSRKHCRRSSFSSPSLSSNKNLITSTAPKMNYLAYDPPPPVTVTGGSANNNTFSGISGLVNLNLNQNHQQKNGFFSSFMGMLPPPAADHMLFPPPAGVHPNGGGGGAFNFCLDGFYGNLLQGSGGGSGNARLLFHDADVMKPAVSAAEIDNDRLFGQRRPPEEDVAAGGGGVGGDAGNNGYWNNNNSNHNYGMLGGGSWCD
ncbi:unnamed protein product [Cuscuta epithymum]|uniref:Dof zinc finger protein n=2 Tax=Cuscuta epithymum TaxID=186058 RepID=A0AAV0GET1_9ASTE|nr:unnamed protein product [Cuscuta epithymum]CAH9146066.1 unnamed protein product [Cuscuta epithymum]